MSQTDYASCMLCEAGCGLAVTHDGERILEIRGDAQDGFSRGYLCPKAAAIPDIQHDPDRLTHPLRKRADGSFEQVSWEQALSDISRRIGAIQAQHGRDAVALYTGNPTGHNYASLLYLQLFRAVLRSRNVYSAGSVDALPRQLASYLLYGNQAIIPVADIERTDMLLVLGANPLVSNGSVMMAPGFGKRLKRLRARGGQLVVIDPRRTETAQVADRYFAIRPGGDAYLLAAMLHTLFVEGLAKPRQTAAQVAGLNALKQAVSRLPPETVSAAVGIEAEDIRQLARAFAAAPSAACYGRMGTCTQPFGTLASSLIDALNLVSGNMDRPGGAMFCTPAVDLVGLANMIGQRGSFASYTSSMRGLPEFNNELPVAAFAEEIEAEGPNRIRALLTHAGNPVLSNPEGRRLSAAFERLDFMVSIDIYLNETTRHADYILPTTFGFEHEHYDVLFHALAVRNVAKYSRPLTPSPPGVRESWMIFQELSQRLLDQSGLAGKAAAVVLRGLLSGGPRRMLDLLLRIGPHGLRGRRLSLAKVAQAEHGMDLGALQPRLDELMGNKPIALWPQLIADDFERLVRELDQYKGPRKLQLISRRELRSNNSWMHNSKRLTKGSKRCTLRIHPRDADAQGLRDGELARITSAAGSIETAVEISDEMMPGVVSLPHGYGHDRSGAKLDVAAARPGVSINDITLTDNMDALSGCTSFAVSVDIAPAPAAPSG